MQPQQRKAKESAHLYSKIMDYLHINLRKNGYMVKINFNHNSNNGYKPDLYAHKNGRELIVEIKSCQHTKNSNYHLKLKRYSFKETQHLYLFVPQKCVPHLKYQIKLMGISAQVFSIDDFNLISTDPGDYFIEKIKN